jgi:acetyl-CoA carboxylase biotin carboxylase subunit
MAVIGRVLIANRGEIAVRIIRTCSTLGIETVLGVSEADRASLPARLADRVICIGPARAAASYLNIAAVIAAATGTGCDAVHPGYGFLSESRALAEACIEAGLIFIGPTPDNLAAVGDKLIARGHADAAGVPLTPGGPATTLAEALAIAERTGFPLLIKSVAGGGGKGMKRVDRREDLAGQFDLAVAEAAAAFGDGRVYLERFVTVGRHIEVQIISDGATILHAGERDCSIQRRYQKVVEEAPAPNLDAAIREKLLKAAVDFARSISYRSLGTVEFLVDIERHEFYFLEMNARIQVEHPVTEAVSGLDLVALQFAIAAGERLPLTQDDVVLSGHAIECRVNAEDPCNGFMPSPGRITLGWFPSLPGLRADTHIESGAVVPPYYDSMIAKLIAWGRTRKEAIAVMRNALAACRVDGVRTNLDLHRAIMADRDFATGGVDTNFLVDRDLLKPAAETVA